MDSAHFHLAPSDRLSARQKQVIICAATGLSNREIAETLFVSPRSVDRDVREACEVFDVPNRTALVLHAYKAGLVRDEHLTSTERAD